MAKSIYSKIVIVVRNGDIEMTPFAHGDEREADDFFERASTQWSDSFLCIVEKGPLV